MKDVDILIEDLDEEISIKSNKEEVKKEKSIKSEKNNMKKNKTKRKKRVKKLNIYLIIISILWLFLIGINTFLVFKYDVLPFKYLLIFLLIVVILPIFLMFLLTRKKLPKGLKIFISIIGILYSLILSFSFFYLNKTFNFLDDFTSGYNYETKNYYVIVLNDSEYQELNDLKNKDLGYLNQMNDTLSKAKDNLDREIEVTYKEYQEHTSLFNDLSEDNISAVLLSDATYQLLSEEDEEFKSNYKIIYEISLKEKTEVINKEVDVTRDTFNIYISGIDSYASVNSLTRSDVNIVASINPKTNQILLINIPRDYYVEFPGTNQKDKLTHAGIYGIDMSVKTIEELLDMEINYYFRVNYAALVNLVDALGGVDVYSKYSFTSVGTDRDYYYKKGYNHLNGEKALYFVRTRKAFLDGDRVRGENQQAMIQAIIKKASSSAILTRYSNILNSLNGSFATNLSTDKITDLVKIQLDTMSSWSITSIGLSGTDSSNYTYTYPYQKLYVMEPNEDTVVAAKDKLEKVRDGEKLDSSYSESTGQVNTPTISQTSSSKKEEMKEEKVFETKEEVSETMDSNLNEEKK